MVARNEREETQQAERQAEISRMEANIKLFTDQQMIRRRNVLREGGGEFTKFGSG
jgi:hypothetical protein